MNTETTIQSAVDDFMAIVKAQSVWGIKHKFASNIDKAFYALYTGDLKLVDNFNFTFEIPQSLLKTIFQKRDPETKKTVHLKYEEIISELEVKGEIVRFKHGGFVQNKKHAATRFLLSKDELKKIFADGNEIKKVLRYWTEDSVYTIRQQVLLLKHIARKKRMTNKTDQDKKDTEVWIDQNRMRIERNRRLGRAKAKRTKIQELTENVEQLTRLVTMLVNNQDLPHEAQPEVKTTKAVAAPKVERKEDPKPQEAPKQVDNSDIDEKSGYDSELLNKFYEKACSLLEQNYISQGQAERFCENVCMRQLTDRRRYKDNTPVMSNAFKDSQKLIMFQKYNALLNTFIKAKQTGQICSMHYTNDPEYMGKAKRTAEQKLESAYNWCINAQKKTEESIYYLVRV